MQNRPHIVINNTVALYCYREAHLCTIPYDQSVQRTAFPANTHGLPVPKALSPNILSQWYKRKAGQVIHAYLLLDSTKHRQKEIEGMRKSRLPSGSEPRIYDQNTSTQTAEPQIPDKINLKSVSPFPLIIAPHSRSISIGLCIVNILLNILLSL